MMQVSFSELSPSEKSFAAYTLLASKAYRENRPNRGNSYDLAAHRLYDASEQAYAAYHAAYIMWRDSGFNPAMFSMLTHFLGRNHD